MADIRVAKRYAKGLYQFTSEVKNSQEVYKEMESLIELIDSSKDLRIFLHSPVLDFKTKQKIAQQLFASYSETTQKFIHVVIQHGREGALKEIAQQYIVYSDAQNHVKKALLISAVELNQDTIDRIVKESQFIGKEDTLVLQKSIDPSIIGGYIFQVGDQQIDASVKSRFTRLKQNFSENYYIPKY